MTQKITMSQKESGRERNRERERERGQPRMKTSRKLFRCESRETSM